MLAGKIDYYWTDFIKDLTAVAREAALAPDVVTNLNTWRRPLPEGGVEALRDFFRLPSHQLAVQTLDYTLFRTPIHFSERPFLLHDTMAVFSTLGSVWFGRAWIRIVDLADECGVPDVAAVRKYVKEQATTVLDRLTVRLKQGPGYNI